MDNINDMNKEYKYRNVQFTYHEWTTFDGRLATGYHCEDEKILDGLNTTSFGSMTITEMQDKIDDYIDNRDEKLEQQEQYNRAEAEYYEKYGTVGEF
tara:strand:+ start:93 stop:383 length:291 start_codon:yes stop_codon:yes gene_type:complete